MSIKTQDAWRDAERARVFADMAASRPGFCTPEQLARIEAQAIESHRYAEQLTAEEN